MIIDPRSDLKHIGRGDSFSKTLTKLFERTGSLEEPLVIVEVGTTRGIYGGGPRGDGWATLAWAWYCKNYGGKNSKVFTVDIDENCISQCKIVTGMYDDIISYNVCTGVEFLSGYSGKPINLLYLDGSDDPQEMVDEYTVALNRGIIDYNTLILLDDIPENHFESGKGQYVIPLLLSHNWEIIYKDTSLGVMQILFGKTRDTWNWVGK